MWYKGQDEHFLWSYKPTNHSIPSMAITHHSPRNIVCGSVSGWSVIDYQHAITLIA